LAILIKILFTFMNVKIFFRIIEKKKKKKKKNYFIKKKKKKKKIFN